jgi:hypothetical protein
VNFNSLFVPVIRTAMFAGFLMGRAITYMILTLPCDSEISLRHPAGKRDIQYRRLLQLDNKRGYHQRLHKPVAVRKVRNVPM